MLRHGATVEGGGNFDRRAGAAMELPLTVGDSE